MSMTPLEALQVVLDQVDYTKGACTVTEMVGACLSTEVIELARQAIREAQDNSRAAVLVERERIIKLACEHCRAGHPMSMKHPMTHHDVPISRRSRGYMMASCKAEEIRAATEAPQ